MAGGGIKQIYNTIRGGADGATFIPTVHENGDLEWSNNKGYTNPPTVNIKGKDGADGKDGATGAKLVSQVLYGQDENGGNIYKQTFDDETIAYFTAPKGEKGDKPVEELEGKVDKILAGNTVEIYAAYREEQTSVPVATIDEQAELFIPSGDFLEYKLDDAKNEMANYAEQVASSTADDVADYTDKQIQRVQSEIDYLSLIVHETVVTETELKDTYVSRITANGEIDIIDGSKTKVFTIEGNTNANYLVTASSRLYGDGTLNCQRNGDGSFRIYGTNVKSGTIVTASCGSEATAPLLEAGRQYYFHFRNTTAYENIGISVGKSGAVQNSLNYQRLSKENLIVGFKPSAHDKISQIEIKVLSGSYDEVDFTITPSIELLDYDTPYVHISEGLYSAVFVGIASNNNNETKEDFSFFLSKTVYLNRWDKLNVETGFIERKTKILTKDTEYTDTELSQYGDYILSGDRKTLMYELKNEDDIVFEEIFIPTKGYTVYKGGTETVEGNGIPVTVTQTYLTKM